MRLVDADALIALVQDSTILGDGFKQAFCALVNGEPTVKPERKTGKWEVFDILDYERPTGRKVGKCPFCGYLTGDFRKMFESYHKLTNFCPNCGADMRGGQDE